MKFLLILNLNKTEFFLGGVAWLIEQRTVEGLILFKSNASTYHTNCRMDKIVR